MQELIKNQTGKTLSTEISELQKEAQHRLENSKSENTKRAYGSDWRQFITWCTQNGLDSLQTDGNNGLLYYISGQSNKASTINLKMVAISQLHETADYKCLTKTSLIWGVWGGLQRSIGIKEQRKEALWLDGMGCASPSSQRIG